MGIISKMKDFEFERAKERDYLGVVDVRAQEMHLEQDGEEVLYKIN